MVQTDGQKRRLTYSGYLDGPMSSPPSNSH
ncbi:hypothetical protein PENVUL_c135G03585 [Penicillium vulpinum]|uniref:Uncharacterized protein n=1 Tax=Penicillium vulpinum TaxID=29845 RepID=A0A1V6R029_9EURO|nr:hypothetical protein PENVUL_c135G03585 [Penicillium vulpinum]